MAPYDKNKLLNHVDEFTAGIKEFALRESISYDLVHAHYWVSGVVARSLQQAWGIPMVQMFHTLGHLKNRVAKTISDREVGARIETERQIMEWSDRLIAATPLEKAQMSWYYGADKRKINVIPAGVDTELFRPRDRAQVRRLLGLPDLDTPILLFVGRIERLKGIDTLLESVAVVSRTCAGRGLKVLIVGGGDQTEEENAELGRIIQLHRDINL